MTTFAKLLSDELSADLKWREDELAVMRKKLLECDPGSVQEAAMLRANVAMLYAHYEGFCKFSIELYLGALEKLKIKRSELRWELATHSMSKLHAALLKEHERSTFFAKLIDSFNTELDESATYERVPQIANLWPDLLVAWLRRIGLEFNDVAVQETLLNSLVSNRNQIAHGKKLVIKDRADFDQYNRVVQLVMHHVAIAIVDALERQLYRRTSDARSLLQHAPPPNPEKAAAQS